MHVDLPRVDPVGLVEVPQGFACARRVHSRALRAAAGALIAAFLTVGVATTVDSLGAWCLTSHAGAPPPSSR